MAKKAKAAKNGGPKPAEALAILKGKPMLRAIRVTPEVLDAARAYKKTKGVSFYALGFESISDRLTKEGFLKKA
jgi:hypothetical protein